MINSLLNTGYALYNAASSVATQNSTTTDNKNSGVSEAFSSLINAESEDTFVLNGVAENSSTEIPENNSESCGSLAKNIEANGSSDTESCGSLANAIKTYDSSNTESCGSLAYETNIVPTTSINTTTSDVSSIAQSCETTSAVLSSFESAAQTSTLEDSKSYNDVLGMQTNAVINSDIQQNTCENIETSAQTSSEAIASNSQATSESNIDSSSISDISGNVSSEEGSVASSNMDCAQASGDNLAYSGGYVMNNQAAAQDAQNGSWTGSFVKENTGWTGAYVEGATSQANESNSMADAQSSANSMPTCSFGEMTAFAHSIMTPDGVQIQANNVTVGAFAMAGAMAGAMSASTTSASGCSTGASSSSSSSSSGAAA